MRQPRATLRGLTWKEADWLWDEVMNHTPHIAPFPMRYETAGREERYRLTVFGMPQAELAEMLGAKRRMR